MKTWLFLGAVNGLSAVAAGAYGWHSLAADDGARTIFSMGVDYQMWHALALIAVAWLASVNGGRSVSRSVRLAVPLAGWAFTIGIVLFSGTLYAFGVTGSIPLNGAAPVGGIFLMTGWAALAWVAIKAGKAN